MIKKKCKDCGKLHNATVESCTCGGESGLSEIEVIVEKESLDTEQLKKDLEAKLKKDMEEKLKTETAKIQNDYLEKLKNNTPKKEDVKDSKPVDSELDEASKIAISRQNAQIEELTNLVKNLNGELEKERVSKKETMVKNEILQRVDKEPYLKDTVQKYLELGMINSIDDYDKIIAPLKQTLKETYERKEKDKEAGKDPMRDYSDKEKKGNQSKDWKKTAKDKYQEEINRMLGIR